MENARDIKSKSPKTFQKVLKCRLMFFDVICVNGFAIIQASFQ